MSVHGLLRHQCIPVFIVLVLVLSLTVLVLVLERTVMAKPIFDLVQLSVDRVLTDSAKCLLDDRGRVLGRVPRC